MALSIDRTQSFTRTAPRQEQPRQAEETERNVEDVQRRSADADKARETRAADEKQAEERRAEAPKVESTPRTPGSGVQMSNDMLVWMQGG